MTPASINLCWIDQFKKTSIVSHEGNIWYSKFFFIFLNLSFHLSVLICRFVSCSNRRMNQEMKRWAPIWWNTATVSRTWLSASRILTPLSRLIRQNIRCSWLINLFIRSYSWPENGVPPSSEIFGRKKMNSVQFVLLWFRRWVNSFLHVKWI